jgi:hypothetical protein
MVANIGIRMDHYSSGSLHWPTVCRLIPMYSVQMLIHYPPNWLEVLQAGRSITWRRWDKIDADRRAAGLSPLYEQTKHTQYSAQDWHFFPD